MFSRLLAAVAALCLLGAPRADAQLLFGLNPAGQQGAPGTALTFNATLTNSGAATVWLNGDNSSISSLLLTLDDTPFYTNAPLYLASGDSWTGDIFSVGIDPSTPPGAYFGTFSIVGGADSSAQDILATQNFEVDVVPEPAFYQLGALLVFGGLGALRLRRRG
jgi:hypothetical protein